MIRVLTVTTTARASTSPAGVASRTTGPPQPIRVTGVLNRTSMPSAWRATSAP
jgi:hypothetical protein